MKNIFFILGLFLFYSAECQLTTTDERIFIPFQKNFYGNRFYLLMNDFIGVSGQYESNGNTYYSYNWIYGTLDTGIAGKTWSASAEDKTSDSTFRVYYQQLEHLQFDSLTTTFYQFSSSLNYVSHIITSSGSLVLDSIKQADGINQLLVCKDTFLYANIENNGSNFIVRKKGFKSSWETLPVLIHKPDTGKDRSGWLLLFIIVLSCAAIAVYILYRKKEKEIIAIQTDANNRTSYSLRLTPDRPRNYEDIKSPDTRAAIDAIIEVIQNRNTPLPMTIAINGAWGSGKSTIMNSIRQKLDVDEEERFITTWFNAWHQQSASSLLDAFLLKIISRYEQPFYKDSRYKAFVSWLQFRLRLGAIRFVKWSFSNQFLSSFAFTFLLLLFLIVCVNLFGLLGSQRVESFFQNIGWINISFKTLLLTSSNTLTKSINYVSTFLAGLLAVVSFFILKSESKPTFGALVSVMYKKTFQLDAEKNNPALREKFRAEYWEMMAAMGDRTLVVFVDDLDRVTGDKIFEMLEAINFISDVASRPDDTTNGSELKTIFVLGLYIDQIAEQLGIYLQKDNPYISPGKDAATLREAEREGKKYLEKMIQLNVPVPLTEQKDIII